MTYRSWQSLLLLSLLVLAVLSDDDPDSFSNHHQVAHLIDWLRSRNGIFHEKLEIKQADQKDSSSRLGIFATRDIKKGELLIAVPSDSFIKGDFADQDGKDSTWCNTVHTLIHEIRRGDASEFAPYVQYLLAQEIGQLPSVWSEAGKDLLIDILDSSDIDSDSDSEVLLPPSDIAGWIEDEWRNDCHGSNDPLEENAAMLAVQRGWDDILIPLCDVIHHRNGKWHNTEERYVQGDPRMDFIASRDILEGEEIYKSYNFCLGCGDTALSYGTAEILRDHGFVEEMPQRWIFEDLDVAFDLNNVDGFGTDLGLSWVEEYTKPSSSAIAFFRDEIQRLTQLAETDLDLDDGTVPRHEWDTIWKYHRAITVAMTQAIKAASGENDNLCSDETGTCTAMSNTYTAFHDREDNLEYGPNTCDNEELLHFRDYETVGDIKSAYQELFFVKHPETDDVCFDLDLTVQICSSYRPHYHESVVHFGARYIDRVRRVVFVGGGDSMLLHEVLKYPSLELVVGLELDQKVTRHSFLHFETQPHFDDERVQWWFGDATKSLLMLPREFFGSFDMVLVDLSETVMSLSVTDELDVLEALALLLKPEGVFVKNELYLNKISEIFNYAVQISWGDNPVACDYTLNVGSNRVDFLHHTLKDHDIEKLWIKPLDINDHFALVHDYRMNVTDKESGQCQELDDEPSQANVAQVTSAGILMIVEAEDITASLQPLEQLERILYAALQNEGLTPISTISSFGSNEDEREVSVILMREGYVVARPYPEHNYCAFDIHLWGGFQHQKNVRNAILAAVRSGSSSSYRIVVGGMFGASTWRYDQAHLGPRVTRTCNNHEDLPDRKGAYITDQSTIDLVLEESMNLVQSKDIVVAVLCGDPQTQSCTALKVLAGNHNVRQVIRLSCPTITDDGDQYLEDKMRSMMACETDTMKTLWKFVEQNQKISAFIVDPDAPIAMAQIVEKILRRKRNRKKLLMQNVLFMTSMFDEHDMWKRNFMERIGTSIMYDPLSRAEIVFSSSDSRMEMGVTSYGDPDFFIHLLDVTKSIQHHSGLNVDIRKVQGGVLNFQNEDEFDPRIFLASDYDRRPFQEQYSTQRPLGHQSVIQMVAKGHGNDRTEAVVISTALIKDAIHRTLTIMDFGIIELHGFANFGDGCVMVALFVQGSVIVVWDGKVHVDINLFTYIEDVTTHDQFVNHFMGFMPHLKISLRDEQPRGIGRVVNFAQDIPSVSVSA